MSSSDDVVKKAQDYYDSSDADNFYFNIWGGEDIHVGWYNSPSEPIAPASARTVEYMLDKFRNRPADTKVLDLGAGYGGSARHIVKACGFHVTALNLSVVQNDRDREMNKAQGLADKIDVIDGSFEDLPFEANSYDVIWSQDSFLHSGNRRKVFEEMDRVAKPGADIIFTDPMQQPGVSKEALQPVLNRIHLETMGSIPVYEDYAKELRWETVTIEEASDKLTMHYTRVLEELSSREEEMATHCSQEYIDKMKTGLGHWIDAGQNGRLAWGILHFRKTA